MTKPYKQYRHAMQLRPGDTEIEAITKLITWAMEHPNYDADGKWEITLEKFTDLGPDISRAISIAAKYYVK